MKQEFQKLITETCERQGWQVPNVAIEYMSYILNNYVERVNWQPEPSWAEYYMTATTVTKINYLAETAWFARSVFPESLERRGLSQNYFTDLGTASYQRLLDYNYSKTADLWARHFEFLAEVAHTAVRYNSDWRSMWEL